MKKLVLVSLLSIFILSTSFVYSQQMMITVEGSKQGLFKAEGNARLIQNKIELTGFEMEVSSPLNVATGMQSGRRVHQPIVIQKNFGASSVQFYEALSTNEVLKSVTIEFYEVMPNGTIRPYYSIKLTNATVIGFRQNAGTANTTPTGVSHGLTDEIKLSYQTIEFSGSGGVSTKDSWSN